MRLLSLDGPPAASGAARQVKFSHDEVIADSAMASLDDFDFALGLMPLIDLDNGQAKAAGMAPSQAPGARYRNGDLVHLNGRIDGHIDDHGTRDRFSQFLPGGEGENTDSRLGVA